MWGERQRQENPEASSPGSLANEMANSKETLPQTRQKVDPTSEVILWPTRVYCRQRLVHATKNEIKMLSPQGRPCFVWPHIWFPWLCSLCSSHTGFLAPRVYRGSPKCILPGCLQLIHLPHIAGKEPPCLRSSLDTQRCVHTVSTVSYSSSSDTSFKKQRQSRVCSVLDAQAQEECLPTVYTQEILANRMTDTVNKVVLPH